MKRGSWAPVLFLALCMSWVSGCGDAKDEVLEEDPTAGGRTSDRSSSESTTGGIPGQRTETDSLMEMGEYDAYDFAKIHYDFDQYRLTPASRTTLTEHAKALMANPAWSVAIEGHCDERGTVEYNLALGEKRANAAQEFLVQYGVNSGRIRTISYGKERPVVNLSNESAWAQNRRAEFRVTK